MLSFITYKNVPEQLEIVGDTEGIQELIDYLYAVKNSKDHLHLTIDSEIDSYPISEKMKDVTLYAKQTRLEYNDTSLWETNK